MPHTIELTNFKVTTIEPLSSARKITLVDAVIRGRMLVGQALKKTKEAYAIVAQTPGTTEEATWSLHPAFRLHFKTLFKLTHDNEIPAALLKVSKALSVLHDGMNSPEFQFEEYGQSVVEKGIAMVAPDLFKGEAAHVRMFALWPPWKMGFYGREDGSSASFDSCVSSGGSTGNPNLIILHLRYLDRGVQYAMDTVVHESTHLFLSTRDDKMKGATFDWMRDDGLASHLHRYAHVPLPAGPGFIALTKEQAISNAYILTAYILYLPSDDLSVYFRKRHALGETRRPVDHVLRHAIMARRPPEDDDDDD